jgi:hypothetical protein
MRKQYLVIPYKAEEWTRVRIPDNLSPSLNKIAKLSLIIFNGTSTGVRTRDRCIVERAEASSFSLKETRVTIDSR